MTAATTAQRGDHFLALMACAARFYEAAEAQRIAHMSASNHLRTLHYAFGVVLIVLSAVVSGSILKSTDTDPSGTLTLLAGSLAIAVTVFTSIQTTFKVGERGEQHKSAGNALGKVARGLEILMADPYSELSQIHKELEKVNEELVQIETGAPGFLGRTYDKARERAKTKLAEATKMLEQLSKT